jgi:hypothetical protein
MKTRFLIAIGGVAIFYALFVAPPSGADDKGARGIMEKVDQRDDGDNMIADMEMTLIDQSAKERVRKMKAFTKDRGSDTLRIMFFLYPLDIKGTGFLTHEYGEPGKEDDQWLYLPALKRTKRIASADKSGPFMGSDFTYADMASLELDDYDFSFFEDQKEIEIHGNKCWIIWAHPRNQAVKDKTGYEKVLLFIRQDNDYLIRAKFWLNTGDYIKFLEVLNLEKVEGVWTATELQMKKTKSNVETHRTILKLFDVKYNQEINDDMFTERQLEKGI